MVFGNIVESFSSNLDIHYSRLFQRNSSTILVMFGTWKYNRETQEVQSLPQVFDPVTGRSSQHHACNRCHEKKVDFSSSPHILSKI